MAQEAAKADHGASPNSARPRARLYNAEVKHRSQLYYKRLEEKNLMIAVFNGWHKPKDDELEFRGENYEPDDAKRLLKKVEKEIEKDNRWITELDQKVFMTYFQMALHIHQAVAEELYRRYDFHLELQNIWYELNKQNGPIDAAINFLNAHEGRPISQSRHFQELLTIFRDAHKAMTRMLKTAEEHDASGPEKPPRRPTARAMVLLENDLVEGLEQIRASGSASMDQRLARSVPRNESQGGPHPLQEPGRHPHPAGKDRQRMRPPLGRSAEGEVGREVVIPRAGDLAHS